MQKFKPVPKCENLLTYFDALRGKYGLEIGGPSNVFTKGNVLPLYPYVRLDGCNYSIDTIWEGSLREGQNYSYSPALPPGYQYIKDAVNLDTIESEKYDFVLSCHSLEHIANPLRALLEWKRILKSDGYLLLVLPEKSGTFDHMRDTVSLDHLISDYKNNIQEDDLTHLPEILKLHDLSRDPGAGSFDSFKKRSLENYKNRALHQHIFDERLVREIFDYLEFEFICSDFVLPFHLIILGRKRKK